MFSSLPACAPADADPDPEEHDLVLRAVSIRQFEEMMLNGTIRDCSTLAAWGLYKLWMERQERLPSSASRGCDPSAGSPQSWTWPAAR